jgi:hypothetical protein
MNSTAPRETRYRQAVHKLITFLHSKRYQPSGMLMDRQNRGRLAASGALVAVDVQTCGIRQQSKNSLCRNIIMK